MVVLVDLAIDLVLLLAIVFLIGLQKGWQWTIGAALRGVADLFDIGVKLPLIGHVRPFGEIAAAFRDLDNAVYHGLGAGVQAAQRDWHRMLLWTAYVLTKTGEELEAISRDLLAYARRNAVRIAPAALFGPLWFLIGPRVLKLIHSLLPKPQAIAHAAKQVPVTIERVTKVEKTVVRVEHVVTTLPKTVTRVVVRPAEAAATKAVAVPVPSLGGIEHDLGRIDRLAKRIGWLGAFAGLAALGAALLSRLKIGWLRCDRWRKVGPRVCGIDPSLLDSLLADTLLIAGTVSLVEFAKGMQGVVRDVEGPIRKFWRAA